MAQQRDRAVERPSRRQAPRPTGTPRPSGRAADLARLQKIVVSITEAAGYDLEHLSVKPVGRRQLVDVVVDSDEGVNLDGVAELSRGISAALDAAEAGGEEIIPGEYDLEVGSPGTDRPLTAERHWRRNIGRLVRVLARGQKITARIVAVDDGVVLDVAGVHQRYALTDLGPGRVQVEFSRPTADDSDASDIGDGIDDEADDGIDDEGEDEE